MSKGAENGFHLLIPAAGSGTRAGLSLPKQYAKIGGKAVLRHTIEKFMGIQGLKSIRVIIDPAHLDLYEEAVAGLHICPPVRGGATRKQSIYNGLRALEEGWDGSYSHDGPTPNADYVMVHDAARPFVTREAINDLISATQSNDAVTLVAPIADTVIDIYDVPVDRKKILTVQTPQIFHQVLIGRAHAHFENDESFTDDAGLVAALGVQVAQVMSNAGNFKITTAEDVAMAEKLLATRTETRTGLGYDVHAFDPAPADKIRLGGIDIPYTKKLLGHSDADVILHALTDALLGTIGDGDIGQLFPPSDNRWKNADSAIFITEARNRVEAKGGKIIHADITLIAEEPKIGPHRMRMLTRLSELLDLPLDRIGLKATTSEGLGAVGRGEGIVAQAVVTVSI